jgi:hypothetical protein
MEKEKIYFSAADLLLAQRSWFFGSCTHYAYNIRGQQILCSQCAVDGKPDVAEVD